MTEVYGASLSGRAGHRARLRVFCRTDRHRRTAPVRLDWEFPAAAVVQLATTMALDGHLEYMGQEMLVQVHQFLA